MESASISKQGDKEAHSQGKNRSAWLTFFKRACMKPHNREPRI